MNKIEICRSYSRKVQNPTNKYENSDYFCSAKMEVDEKDAVKTSEKLHKIVVEEVNKTIEAERDVNIGDKWAIKSSELGIETQQERYDKVSKAQDAINETKYFKK